MTHKPISEQEAVTRLHHALTATDTLTPAEAQALLPALVEAECAGVDVDRDPTFAALLTHLDHNAESMALYLELSEDLATLLDLEEDLPAVPAPPTFFQTQPARSSEKVSLRILQGLRRRFELTLAMPSMAQKVATLNSKELFNDSLREIEGAPLVAVSLHVATETADLLMVVRDATPTTRWQVNLRMNDRTYTAHTNDQGIVRFVGLGVSDLQQAAQITITCSALS